MPRGGPSQLGVVLVIIIIIIGPPISRAVKQNDRAKPDTNIPLGTLLDLYI